MKQARRLLGLFAVLLALFQALPVAAEAWQAGRWPQTWSDWLRLAFLPAALWFYLRYFSILACRRCDDDRRR